MGDLSFWYLDFWQLWILAQMTIQFSISISIFGDEWRGSWNNLENKFEWLKEGVGVCVCNSFLLCKKCLYHTSCLYCEGWRRKYLLSAWGLNSYFDHTNNVNFSGNWEKVFTLGNKNVNRDSWKIFIRVTITRLFQGCPAQRDEDFTLRDTLITCCFNLLLYFTWMRYYQSYRQCSSLMTKDCSSKVYFQKWLLLYQETNVHPLIHEWLCKKFLQYFMNGLCNLCVARTKIYFALEDLTALRQMLLQ